MRIFGRLFSETITTKKIKYDNIDNRGCSKSPIKMTHRISSLACFSAAHVSKSIHSAAQSCAALNFLVLFIVLFEHTLIENKSTILLK